MRQKKSKNAEIDKGTHKKDRETIKERDIRKREKENLYSMFTNEEDGALLMKQRLTPPPLPLYTQKCLSLARTHIYTNTQNKQGAEK